MAEYDRIEISATFENHQDKFTANDLKNFQSVRSGAKHDCTFVFNVVKAMYRNDLDILRGKSVTGRSKNSDKSVMTPDKTAIVKKMLEERVMNEHENIPEERLK